MVIHDVMRRKYDCRACAECDDTVVVNADDAEEIDQHHVLGFSDGSGGQVGTEYASYVFCSVTCFRDWVRAYFQQMLEMDAEDGGPELTENEQAMLHSEG